MRDFEKSATIETSADHLFGYLADVRHLSAYFPKVLAARLRDDQELLLLVDIDGRAQEVGAWFRVDEDRRRVEWGVPASG